jgi:GNAT superfamily N-acetyltransferase
MTYNRPYYEDLVEDYGFEKVEDLIAFYAPTDIVDRLDPKLYKVIDIAKKKFNLKLRKLDKTRFDEEVHTFLDIYNKSLPGTWGFNPLSGAELKHMAKGLKHLLVPELTCFAEVEGKVIGACVALLDYNDIIKEIDGKLFPFGFIKLLTKRRGIKKMRLLSANVLPEYQMWGVGVVLLSGLEKDYQEWGMKHIELSWVLESNHRSYASIKRGGGIVDKTYRIYDKKFDD